MPLYEYLCASCGHRFERIQKFSDPPVGECPACGGAVEKQVSSPAIQFKGSGWYINDYAKPGKSDVKSDGDKGDKKEAPSPADAKADKPASDSKAEKPAASESAAKPTTGSADNS